MQKISYKDNFGFGFVGLFSRKLRWPLIKAKINPQVAQRGNIPEMLRRRRRSLQIWLNSMQNAILKNPNTPAVPQISFCSWLLISSEDQTAKFELVIIGFIGYPQAWWAVIVNIQFHFANVQICKIKYAEVVSADCRLENVFQSNLVVGHRLAV